MKLRQISFDKNLKHIFGTLLLLTLAYAGGVGFAKASPWNEVLPVSGQAGTGWGLSFQEEGKPPVTDMTADALLDFDAYCMEKTDEKILYLTFDCGFENGNTPAILDALKKHQVPAAFFVVGHYIESSPELVQRMVDEGHTVANHTYHHPDMTRIHDRDAFSQELTSLEALYKETTGQTMVKYYRPPQGLYSEASLKMARDLGCKTFFWSLAYVDWQQDNQPSHEEAFQKLLSRVHPGAIVLLHNTSRTNGEIIDELLTRWEEMGYEFRELNELCD